MIYFDYVLYTYVDSVRVVRLNIEICKCGPVLYPEIFFFGLQKVEIFVIFLLFSFCFVESIYLYLYVSVFVLNFCIPFNGF